MRLHSLEVTAFGPFGGTEWVDFDRLGDSGLFLLCGATGAGKTSILDAVCFALFGQVPGDRDKAKRLRSDHAAPASGPRVVLDVSVRGRRLRLTRSPEWLRPKKRGTGEVREPAKALVEERLDGRWEQRTNRIDEAGDFVGSLLGLTLSQFLQVALLPQGRFETFLRSGAQERHALLERLFGTRRFRAVEDWLAEHRRGLSAQSAERADEVTAVLERLAEVGERERPDDLEPPGPAPWAEGLRRDCVAALAEASQARAAAGQRAKDARAALDHARETADLQRRHARAAARDADLRALGDDTAQLARRLERARLAATVRPHLQVDEAAGRAAERARAELDAARDDLAADPDPAEGGHPRPDPLVGVDAPSVAAQAASRARDQVARLEALRPLETRVDALARELGDLDARVERLDSERASLHAQAERGAAELDRLRDARAQALRAQAGLDPLRERVRRAERVSAAAHRVPRLRADRSDRAQARAQAAERAQDARQRWLDVRQARLDGMAAELALRLAAGASCPVCGSTGHPDPAEPRGDQVSAEAEKAAEAAWHEAEEERGRRERHLAECDQEIAVVLAESEGADVAGADAALGEVAAQLRHTEEAAACVDDLGAALARAQDDADATKQRITEVVADLAQLAERRSLLSAERDEARARLVAETGAHRTLARRIEHATRRARRYERVHEALRRRGESAAAAEDARERLDTALSEAGFGADTDARDAELSRTEMSNAETLLRTRADEEAQVRADLHDPRLVEAARAPAVMVEPLEVAVAQADEVRDAAVAHERAAEHRATRVEQLRADLHEALTRWEPVRSSLAVADRMASLCAGTSAENRHKMRLSAYVLAARLEQVVAAANERLLRMSSGRFTLQHSVERGVGDRRGGLGLQVHDGWTGDLRDPATLSGGETFFTSLALALGLADVVSHEAGGTEIDTLFVDEGFGSLDPETLDEVMDVLDALRSGGRTVGIVSHVGDLRARIPAQVHVRKTRAGSTLVGG